MLPYFIGFSVGLGVFFFLLDLFHVPTFASSKAVNTLAHRQERKTSSIDIWLGDFAIWISKHIRLNEYRKIQMQSDLRTAGIPLSPEMHIADALVKSLIIGVTAIPVYFIMPMLTLILLALAVMMYFKSTKGIADKIRGKRKKIEYELPRLVAHIEKTLKHNRDVLYIIDSYKSTAGKALYDELEITAADMRSGNYEAALTRLESRVGSSMLSDVTRGLIGVLRGDETAAYWTNLAMKFADYQRQLLKGEAAKVPAKVKRLSMCLLLCFMAMYIVVIGVQIVVSLGGLIG